MVGEITRPWYGRVLGNATNFSHVSRYSRNLPVRRVSIEREGRFPTNRMRLHRTFVEGTRQSGETPANCPSDEVSHGRVTAHVTAG